MSAPRFAIYYAPPYQSSLWNAGAQWLGRDDDNAPYESAALFHNIAPKDHAALSATARHYGFHATLKSPFRLIDGRRTDDLMDALDDFTKNRPPFTGPLLEVGEMDGFIALKTVGENPVLNRFASACVRAFDDFRGSETPEQIRLRQRQNLSLRQRSLLAAWGYPFVFEEFSFHMTLSERPEDDRIKPLIMLLRRHFKMIVDTPLWIDAVSLFHQKNRSAPFTLAARYPLRG